MLTFTDMNKRGFILIVSGASGTGKSTLCNMVVEQFPNITFSVSCTTRKPRVGEKEGVNYYFKDVSEFKKLIEEDAFFEYANVYGNYYGTLIRPVLEKIENGNSVLLDIDVQGAMSLKKRALTDSKLAELLESVFILPPTIEELELRLRSRATDSEEVINKRLANAIKEINHFTEYDYFIVNDDINLAFEKFKLIIESLSFKTKRINKPKVK